MDALEDHAASPRNRGTLDGADGAGSSGGECADSVTIAIRVADDHIARIAFQSDGCREMIAAASMTTELARGKHLDEAAEITQDTVLTALGGLPADKRHVAQLTVEALDNAIWDCVARMIERGSDL